MQENKEKNIYLKQIMGEVFRQLRKTNTKLSCNKAEEEYGIGRGILNRLENGKTDPSFTTLWKAAEANGEKLSHIIEIIENKVGENFSLTD